MRFNRQSHRLRGWDYRTPASYFITICTDGRIEYFNHKPTEQIARRYWMEIPKRHPHVALGEYAFVHNHMHGIITITRFPETYGIIVGAPFIHERNTRKNDAPTKPHDYYLPGSIGAIIQGYKIITKRVIRFGTKHGDFAWQRDFWDHIIRNENEYAGIEKYIRKNPAQWEHDRNNPASDRYIKDGMQDQERLPWHDM